MILPDCPRCSTASGTLEPVRAEGNGVKVCCCACCGQLVRVNAEGAVVHVERQTDISGHPMTDP